MGRIIVFFIVFALFLAFIMLNLENKCSVNFGFHIFDDVPIYMTSFISIFIGMLFSIPFISSLIKKNGKPGTHGKPDKKNKSGPDYKDDITTDNSSYGIN